MRHGLPFEVHNRKWLEFQEANSAISGATPSQDIGTTPQAMPFDVAITTFSSECHPKKQTTFSPFGRLPAELRNKIWNAALAPRVIMIYPRDGRTQTESPQQIDWKKIPGILFANRESRKIAEHHYDQKFTLAFCKSMPMVVMCQIPVVMSAHDELAMSAIYLSTKFEERDIADVTVTAAVGAPQPLIQRISLLGPSLTREGINQEHLAQLLSMFSGAWDIPGDSSAAFPWTTRWSPFGKQPDPTTFGRHLGDVEDVSIQHQITGSDNTLEDWLWMTFNLWCFDSIYDNEWDWVDAWVAERPEPDLEEGDEEEQEGDEE